jgi:hypothetical protein
MVCVYRKLITMMMNNSTRRARCMILHLQPRCPSGDHLSRSHRITAACSGSERKLFLSLCMNLSACVMAFLRNLKSHAPLAINKYRPLGAAASVRARIVISNFLKGEREREREKNTTFSSHAILMSSGKRSLPLGEKILLCAARDFLE